MNHGFEIHSSADLFAIDYKPIRETRLDFRQATELAAKKILERTQRPTLFFSGGADSEVMMRSFLAHTRDLEVVFVRFCDDLNSHEWEFAKLIAHRLGFSIQVIDFDLLSFWAKECKVYAEKSKSFSPQLNAHIKMAELAAGVSVFGIGEPELEQSGNQINWIERERDYSWYRYFYEPHLAEQGQKKEFIAFFQSIPEMSFCFLRDFLMQKAWDLESRFAGNKLDFLSYKKIYYSKFWPDFLVREKWTGFERLQNEDFVLRKTLKAQHGHRDRILSIPLVQMWKKMNQSAYKDLPEVP